MLARPSPQTCLIASMAAVLPRVGVWVAMVLTVATPSDASAEDIAVKFAKGGSNTLSIRFSDYQAEESWFLRRCQGQTAPDYHVTLQEYGDVLVVNAVNSALEADKTVCVIGHIPNVVKRHMR